MILLIFKIFLQGNSQTELKQVITGLGNLTALL